MSTSVDSINGSKFACSIVIPVRNGEEFVRDCVDSILNQMYSRDFEVIFVNDHSSDRTVKILEKYSSGRPFFQILESRGVGIASALNQGILAANSEIIVRMDADDVMISNRLKLQMTYLEQNPDCVLLGGQIQMFGTIFPLPIPNSYPGLHQDIIKMLCFGNSFAHPTVAFRRDLAILAGLYDSDYDGAEDYEFWTRLAKYGKMHNLMEVLTMYRVHERQVTREKIVQVQKRTYATQFQWIFKSSHKDWSVSIHRKYLFKLEGLCYLIMRISRDKLERIFNGN